MQSQLSCNNKYNSNTGFTLIELLLYIALISIIVLVASQFLQAMNQSQVKNQTIAEVEQQGTQVMQIITQAIRNAESISAPNQGADGSLLSLTMLDSNKSPTEFDLSSGAIRIKKEKSTVNIPLTSSRVTASSLSFYNLSRASTPGVIRVQFTLTYTNTGGRNEWDYSKTFYGSASLR